VRKVAGVFMILALLILCPSVVAQPGECEVGGVFRGTNGEVLDCVPGLGEDCLACTFIVK
jgi:hypothetical protein